MVERALLLAQGEPLSTAHFPGLDEVTIPLHKSEDMWDLDEIEKYHIIRAMEHFNNDKIMVSKALGISLSSLYRKLDSINNAIPA
jgi:DNA-binding NtrC family response regulator